MTKEAFMKEMEECLPEGAQFKSLGIIFETLFDLLNNHTICCGVGPSSSPIAQYNNYKEDLLRNETYTQSRQIQNQSEIIVKYKAEYKDLKERYEDLKLAYDCLVKDTTNENSG